MPERSQQLRTLTGHKRSHSDTNPSESRLTAQCVLAIAQSISHLPTVTESAASALIPDAEFRIRQIVQDAIKFRNHSKRRLLSTCDINLALRVRNADPVYGFGPLAPTYQQPLTSLSTSLNVPSSSQQPQRLPSTQSNPSSSPHATSAQVGISSNGIVAMPGDDTKTSGADMVTSRDSDDLQPRGDAPLPSMQVIPITFDDKSAAAQYVQVTGNPDLFFAHDVESNLQDILKSPLPPVPLEVVVNAHWLAIDSVQPKIPQNPVHIDDDEITELGQPLNKKGKITSSKRAASDEDKITGGKVPTIVKPPIKHVLSCELQTYYDFVRRALFSYDIKKIQTTLSSIATEHGIVQLLPYFAAFIAQTIRNHLHDLPLLMSLMRMVWAMNENSMLSIDKYLHQLLPGILTCIVGNRLSESARHNHWALRDYAAELARTICQRFEKSYAELKQRMIVTLCDAFQPGRTLPQCYGAIVGLAALGPLVVKRTLIPKLAFVEKVEEALESNQLKVIKRFEAAKVYCAVACAVYKARILAQNDPSKDEKVRRVTSVPPEELDDVLPLAQKLIPALESEFGDGVYPLGVAAEDEDVVTDILNLVDKSEAIKRASG